jgi:predicted house-cleaning noncanonical NTP pyrophosphatase (MazG superfamily)
MPTYRIAKLVRDKIPDIIAKAKTINGPAGGFSDQLFLDTVEIDAGSDWEEYYQSKGFQKIEN